MKTLYLTTLLAAICFASPLFAQYGANETKKWYFGTNAGLDFMTSPPTVLTNGALQTVEGCAAVSDAAGNLLFYTNGVDIWNSSHAIMANGGVLSGNISSSQSAVIARKPGSSNLYYLFTNSGPWGPGAGYSVVDMSLAAGMGSVTVRDVMLSDTTSEKLCAVRHCNGVDFWIVFHDWFSADFKAFLLTASGLNPVPVVSNIGSWHGTNVNADYAGCMKASPNGKKLGLAILGQGVFEMFDFDNTTGVISNSLSLSATPLANAYGCEFSPDGTKFYGTTAYSPGRLYQWDLCAGSDSAVVASMTQVYYSSYGLSAMQNASDGKIYIARFSNNTLGIINNPNGLGTACNYVDAGLSLAPKTTIWSLPNFIGSKPVPPPITFTSGCNTTSFTAPPPASGTICQVAAFPVSALAWNFGDPASGTANTSTLVSPTHIYSGIGTYSAQLIMYYSCGGGPDTLKQVVTVSSAAPVLTVSGKFSVCAGEKQIYTASGAGSYSWNTGAQTPTIAVTFTNTTAGAVIYTLTGTSATNSCAGTKTFAVNVEICSGIESHAEFPVEVYPNPAGNVIHLNCVSKVSVKLSDLQGRVLLETELMAGVQKVDLSALTDGIYSLRVSDGMGYKVMRMVKRAE